MSRLTRLGSLCGFLMVLAGVGVARAELEVIPLRYRTVDQVLPVLRPLVEAGGSLTGMNNQLFLNTSPRNREDILRVLAAVDTPPRRLVIQLSQDRGGESRVQGGSVAVQLGEGARTGGTRYGSDPGFPGSSRVEIRRGGNSLAGEVVERRETRSQQNSQMVQVMEGGSAYIEVGQSVPVEYSGGYRDLGQGFYASPRVNGELVTVDLAQQSDDLRPGTRLPGRESLVTTVTGRLGEWIPLGATRESQDSRQGRWGGQVNRQGSESRTLWLRVDEVR